MTTVRITDHTDEFLEQLKARIGRACEAAAGILADNYREALTATWSFQSPTGPPHSRPGEVPHRYLGHRPGGYRVHGYGQINNQGQTDFLANYMTSDSILSEQRSCVGFSQNHTRRGLRGWVPGTNYLISHDPMVAGIRPWITPIYNDSRQEMVSAMIPLIE